MRNPVTFPHGLPFSSPGRRDAETKPENPSRSYGHASLYSSWSGAAHCHRYSCSGGLASMAGPRSHATVERDRSPEAMAGGRTAGRLDDDRTWIRLRFDGGCGRSRLRSKRAQPQQRRHCAQSCGWEGSLVEGAGGFPDGRPGTGTARHSDRRRRSSLRAERERRSGVPRDRRHRGVAAQYPPRVWRPAAAMADQRVPTRRRPACHCFSRRARRQHGEAGQDDGKDRLDRRRTSAILRRIRRSSRRTCKACART